MIFRLNAYEIYYVIVSGEANNLIACCFCLFIQKSSCRAAEHKKLMQVEVVGHAGLQL